MKTIKNYILEKQNFLIKGHTKKQETTLEDIYIDIEDILRKNIGPSLKEFKEHGHHKNTFAKYEGTVYLAYDEKNSIDIVKLEKVLKEKLAKYDKVTVSNSRANPHVLTIFYNFESKNKYANGDRLIFKINVSVEHHIEKIIYKEL